MPVQITVILTGGVVALAVLLMVFQDRLIYYPDPVLIGTPADRGLDHEEVYFDAADGVKLHGWFVPAAVARATLLFCHGNAGNISNRLESIEIFHRLGLSVFIFDYRGYGRSEGRPSEAGTYADVEGAWRYLLEERKLEPQRIVAFGRSLGGPIATRLAVKQQPALLIVESSFTSLPDIGKKVYPFLPVRLMLRYRYPTEAMIRQVRCPVLVIHSNDDELAPYAHGRRLFEAANPPKSFLDIQGSHADGFFNSGTSYTRGLDQFLSTHLSNRHAPTPLPRTF